MKYLSLLSPTRTSTNKLGGPHVKLLLLGLLRTVSAWATTSTTTSPLAVDNNGKNSNVGAGPDQQRQYLPQQPEEGYVNSQQRQQQRRNLRPWTADRGQYRYESREQQQQPPPSQQQLLPPLTLRLACRADVPSIQRCNLATLPENYNQQFYADHMRAWPELAFVVVVSASEEGRGSGSGGRSDELGGGGNSPQSSNSDRGGWNAGPFGGRFGRSNNNGNHSPIPVPYWQRQQQPQQLFNPSNGNEWRGNGGDEKVVAYVLGKVEDQTVQRLVPVEESLANDADAYYEDRRRGGGANNGIGLNGNSPRIQRNDNMEYYGYHQNHHVYRSVERLGHVTSLAVLDEYRRRGLAVELMKQLHLHMLHNYGAESVGLHVRQSNVAAERLYSNFGYVKESRIPGYYQDGEDAFLMKKRLVAGENGASALQQQQQQQRGGGGFFGSLRRNNRPPSASAWQQQPHGLEEDEEDLRLPRTVGVPQQQQQQHEELPELMTGTM